MNVGNLFIGIVAGVFATIIIFIFDKIIKAIFIPWFEERVYKDLKIEGEWIGTVQYADKSEEKTTIHLMRNGHKINGNIISQLNGKGYITYYRTTKHTIESTLITLTRT